MTNPPKRKPRSKLKKINTSTRQHWQRILKDIDTDHIPINLLQTITVNLIDDTKITINVQELLAEGNDPETLDRALRTKMRDLDHIIKDVDFFINVDAVADAVQPLTDKILKDL